MPDAEIDLGASFSLSLGTAVSDIKKHMSDLKPNHQGRILRPITAADQFTIAAPGIAVGAQGYPFLDLGSPEAGRIWVVTMVTILGVDDSTTATNTKVALYVGDPYNTGPGQCKLPAQAVPAFVNWNMHAMVVHDRENLFGLVRASAAINSQQVVINATVWEYRDCDFVTQVI
jgi:hypothetical protein